jgi:DNA-binding transcriptional LysR family regulator
MNKRELNYFLKVYEYKSIKKAAEDLFISSQGLSKTIKNLEQELGVSLFTRTAQGVEPTIHAHNLKRRAKIIISEFENIKNDINYDSEITTTVLHVLSTCGMLKYLTLHFVQDFYYQYPNIRLNIVEYPDGAIETILKEEQAEIAFLAAPFDTINFDATFCVSHKNCLIIHKSNPLAQKDYINFEDLKMVPIAVNGRDFNSYHNSINLWVKNGVTPNVLLETSEDYLIHEVARTNLGIGISLDYIAQANRSFDTVIRPVPDESCGKDVYMVKKSGKKLSNEAQCFVDYALNWLKIHRPPLNT